MFESLGFGKETQTEKIQYTNDVEEKVMTNAGLLQNVKYIERILNEYSYHKQYVTYRNYPEINIKFDKISNEAENNGKRLGGFRNLQQKQNKVDSKFFYKHVF